MTSLLHPAIQPKTSKLGDILIIKDYTKCAACPCNKLPKNEMIMIWLSLLVLNNIGGSCMQIKISYSQGTKSESLFHLWRRIDHQFAIIATLCELVVPLPPFCSEPKQTYHVFRYKWRRFFQFRMKIEVKITFHNNLKWSWWWKTWFKIVVRNAQHLLENTTLEEKASNCPPDHCTPIEVITYHEKTFKLTLHNLWICG